MIPYFKDGNPSARDKLNRMVDDLTRLSNITGDGLVSVSQHINGTQIRLSSRVSASRERQRREADLVLIKNDTEGTLGRFSVLEISGVLNTPDTHMDEFAGRVILTGVAPTAANKPFVITAEPLEADEVGFAFVSGACQVIIDRTNNAHTYCDIIPEQTGRLLSSVIGSARILYKEASNPGWGVVLLGASSFSGISRAQAQEDAPTSAELSVKFYADGGAVGDAFNVKTINGDNWTDVFPGIAENSILLITNIGDSWYGVGFSPFAQCP